MGSTVPGGETAANIDGERSSHRSIDSGSLDIVLQPEPATVATVAGLEQHRPAAPTRTVPRPPAPADDAPATPLDVYAAITSAIAAGCVAPPRLTLREHDGARVAELEFPQGFPGARGAVDTWAAEFEAVPRIDAEILAVRYGFEPADCRERFVAGWGLRVLTHLDLPPMLGGVDAAGVWREPQPHGVGSSWVADSHTAGGCPAVRHGAPTTSSPVGLEGARPGPDSGASQGAAVGGGTADDQTPVVVLASRRGALGAAAHTNPAEGDQP